MGYRARIWLWLLFMITSGVVFGGVDPQIIRVSSEKELVRAIGPDRRIILEPKVYNLAALDGDEWDSPYLAWEPVFDGRQLTLRNLANLTLEGAGSRPVKMVTECRYAFVLGFQDCNRVRISNIEAGHTPEKGHCTGGVFYFGNCRDVAIDRCILFGCGKEGLNLQKVDNLKFTDSTITECTYHIMTMDACRDISFVNAQFLKNGAFDLINIHRSSGVAFERCTISHNTTGSMGYDLFKTTQSSGLVLKDSRITHNRARFFICGDKMETAGNKLEGNSFSARDILIVAEPKTGTGEVTISENPFQAVVRTRWRMGREQVKKLEKSKLVEEQKHALLYRSKLLGLDCTILYCFAGYGLDTVTYRIRTGEGKTGVHQFTEYHRLRRILAREYGEPVDSGDGISDDPLPSDFFTVPELEAEIELLVDPEDVSVVVVFFGYAGEDGGEEE